ncbi:hypothetical protein HanXRQr2_Chr08g0319201 [Helianthus annuus]|uniref:Uncharacterized protein n=1 Tax=Helianthus annuus TaxID=4232 RepID=A0A9K3ICJ8_HELAN|nr:hypothetical protein HanXRQr2_Chr08g0319201 [Helianthus annuus]
MPEMLAHETPVQLHGVSSLSFQSENTVSPPSTADLMERRERPSEVRAEA